MVKYIPVKKLFHVVIFSFLLLFIIGLVDYFTGAEIAFSIFYLVPVLMISLHNDSKPPYIFLVVLVAAIVWFLAEYYANVYSNRVIPLWNAFVRLTIFLIVGFLAFYLNQKHQKLVVINKHLEGLNEEKNKLIGIAAHDLRNPVGTIFSFSDLLLTSYSDKADPRVLELILYIKQTSSHTLELLEQLLDLSKIESGTVVLTYRWQNYIDFLRNYITFSQLLADEKQIKINFSPGNEEIYFSFDEHYLSEVITNLLTNAIKYSYPHSEIKVRLSETKNQVRTEVIDNGKGIPREEQEKLFGYFQRTSVKPTAGEKSTGLGLAIAKKIVIEHGGKISVKSEPGKGSTFWFELPKRKK